MTYPVRPATVSSGIGPYSLSGHPLDGNNVVRLVYIDEAGISNKKEEPWLVVAGAIVHADHALNGIENELERILLRNIPERSRDKFVFHATHLFNSGGKVFRKIPEQFIGPREWPLERRLKIADQIMALPKKFKVPLAFGFVERSEFPTQFDMPSLPDAEMTIAAHAATFMACSMMVEHWMRKDTSNENCLLVVEDNDSARKLIRDVHRHHQDKNMKLLLETDHTHFPLTKIKEDPLFQPKRPSSALILADFCAYVFKRYLMGDKRYDRFMAPISSQIISFDQAWLTRRPGRRVRSLRRSDPRPIPERSA